MRFVVLVNALLDIRDVFIIMEKINGVYNTELGYKNVIAIKTI